MIILLILIVLFIVIGFYFSSGKGEFLIAGFNTMPKEEQEKYDSVALCKFMGKMMFIYTFCLSLWLIAHVIDEKILFYIGLVLFMMVTIFSLVYMNISERLKK